MHVTHGLTLVECFKCIYYIYTCICKPTLQAVAYKCLWLPRSLCMACARLREPQSVSGSDSSHKSRVSKKDRQGPNCLSKVPSIVNTALVCAVLQGPKYIWCLVVPASSRGGTTSGLLHAAVHHAHFKSCGITVAFGWFPSGNA